MATYKLQKKNHFSRRVVVRQKKLEWNIPAIIICILLAVAIWLYLVNFSSAINTAPTPQETTATETAPPPSDESEPTAEAAVPHEVTHA